MVNKECIVCGAKLEGRQTKYCSNKCKYVFNRPYYLKYQQNYRKNSRNIKFCMVCGKKLTGRQKKYCSLQCRNRNKREDFYKFLNNSSLSIVYPNGDNKCEECDSLVICEDNECFCSKCGLVVQ